MSKDLNKAMGDLFKETDKIFKQVDQVFKIMEKTMERADAESWESINKRQKWEPYISWVPRKIGKSWYWHSPIYRKYQHTSRDGYYVYGTEFDVLKDSK
jgi:hypothetical protein